MLIRNVFDTMNNSEVLGESLDKATDVRIRVSADFLNECSFRCDGCYVSRKNSCTEDDLDILGDIVTKWKGIGLTFDEVILGPTDFFASSNAEEVLSNPKFKQLFENGDVVLTILSTMLTDEVKTLETIEMVNRELPFEGFEMEVLIPLDMEQIHAKNVFYVMDMKRRIQLLNNFDCKVDYAVQMNIQDIEESIPDFNVVDAANFVREQFGTILEFNPSFMRSRLPRIVNNILEKWNGLITRQITQENKHNVTFTMANDYHAGFNEITYNFRNGMMYMCPFIYENVFDHTEPFVIEKSGEKFYEIEDFMNHDIRVKAEQYAYLHETSECESCPHLNSCVAKHVIYYMKSYDHHDCILAKKTIDLYTDTPNESQQKHSGRNPS